MEDVPFHEIRNQLESE